MLKYAPLTLSLWLLLTGLILCSPIIFEFGTNDAEGSIEVVDNNLDSLSTQLSTDAIDLTSYGVSIFGEPDEKDSAKLVANYKPDTTDVNPEELGSYLEGDILIPKEKAVTTKNGLTTQSSRWLQGIVPFEAHGKFNDHDMSIIAHAIAEYHKRTCIRFVPRTIERDYISIVSGNSGCWSAVGRVGGKQEVNLQSPGCLTKPGTTIHELMHVLGFLHEQNREERDSFVQIRHENIQSSARPNFARARRTVSFGVPYDYGSVMHYSATAFSRNGQPTIVPVRSLGSTKMGQRDDFSVLDVKKVNQMYNCGRIAAPASAGMESSLDNSFLNGIISGVLLGDKPSKYEFS